MREYALIGDYDTWRDWGVELYDVEIGLPELKTHFIELPLESTTIDLSEVVTGRSSYGTRKIKLYLGKKDKAPPMWADTISRIAGAIHGKRLPVILSFDPEFYYIGRFSCETEKISYRRSVYQITATCDTYKYCRKLTERTVDVDGTKEISLLNMEMVTSPTFTTDATDITASCNGEGARTVFPGTDVNIPDILLLPGQNLLTLTGSGVVKIKYQEGMI